MAKKNDKEDDSHPFQDHTSRFALDVMIREAGFRIHSRKKGKPVLWSCASGTMEQNEIVKGLDWDGVRDALYAEDLYEKGMS